MMDFADVRRPHRWKDPGEPRRWGQVSTHNHSRRQIPEMFTMRSEGQISRDVSERLLVIHRDGRAPLNRSE